MLTESRINQIYVAEKLTKSYYGEYAYFGIELLNRINEDYANIKITEDEWKEYTDTINYYMDLEYKQLMEFNYDIDSNFTYSHIFDNT